MLLPNLEYGCAVFHGFGNGNEEELESLQSVKDGAFVHSKYGFRSWLGPSEDEKIETSSKLSRIFLMDKLQVISHIILTANL